MTVLKASSPVNSLFGLVIGIVGNLYLVYIFLSTLLDPTKNPEIFSYAYILLFIGFFELGFIICVLYLLEVKIKSGVNFLEYLFIFFFFIFMALIILFAGTGSEYKFLGLFVLVDIISKMYFAKSKDNMALFSLIISLVWLISACISLWADDFLYNSFPIPDNIKVDVGVELNRNEGNASYQSILGWGIVNYSLLSLLSIFIFFGKLKKKKGFLYNL